MESAAAWAGMKTLRVALTPPLPLGSSVAAGAKAGGVFACSPHHEQKLRGAGFMDRVTTFVILRAVCFYLRMFPLSSYSKAWLYLSKK